MNITITPTPWDDEILHLKTAKIIINDSIDLKDMDIFMKQLISYDFVVIQTNNQMMQNHFFLGSLPFCYLTDIQVRLHNDIFISPLESMDPHITICNNFEYRSEILTISKDVYRYSRFFNDSKLTREQVDQIYPTWCKNSFGQKEKYFATYEKDGDILAYLLFRFDADTFITELQATSQSSQGQGYGKRLLIHCIDYGIKHGFVHYQIGTQLANLPMISLYEKNGYTLFETRSVYHYWPKGYK